MLFGNDQLANLPEELPQYIVDIVIDSGVRAAEAETITRQIQQLAQHNNARGVRSIAKKYGFAAGAAMTVYQAIRSIPKRDRGTSLSIYHGPLHSQIKQLVARHYVTRSGSFLVTS